MLIDSNVLIDVGSRDPKWSEWSLSPLQLAAGHGQLHVNAVIYAETSVRYQRLQDFDHFLAQLGISVEMIPHPALFLAGKVFKRYRQTSGTKTGVLPDFFIGAHASVAKLPLLTRDPRRYRTYFPDIDLIGPD